MTSTAIKSQGTTLGVSQNTSPIAYTVIVNITSISGPNRSANLIDVTDLSSSAREYLQGLEDEGEVSFEGYYDSANAQHQAMRDNVGASQLFQYQITLTSGATIDFDAFVMSFNIGPAAVDGAVEVSGSLKISGSVTHSS